ncbi:MULTISPECIES: hypothetical protein [unclassified Sphingobacterium]|uniref:hypothetical protein n=1 Tax=unclassified Sphingobacterium TaxID=2609468 RepID=UPI00143C57B7|nr:hypothetical protein [Sphingobacterium sp. B16(2022)]NJI74252.1 hypothetical protein [Sphingobacterium sp. B16(2022)]
MKTRSAPDAEPIKWWKRSGINYLLMSHFLSEFYTDFRLNFCSTRQGGGQKSDAVRSSKALNIIKYIALGLGVVETVLDDKNKKEEEESPPLTNSLPQKEKEVRDERQ